MKGRTTSSLVLTDITWPRAGVTHATLQIGILTAESRAYLLPHREVFVLDYAQTEQSVLKLSSHTVIHTTHKVQRNDFETGNTLILLMGAKNAWLALETQDSIYSMGFRISFIVLDRVTCFREAVGQTHFDWSSFGAKAVTPAAGGGSRSNVVFICIAMYLILLELRLCRPVCMRYNRRPSYFMSSQRLSALTGKKDANPWIRIQPPPKKKKKTQVFCIPNHRIALV
jgi:hypothetical protein